MTWYEPKVYFAQTLLIEQQPTCSNTSRVVPASTDTNSLADTAWDRVAFMLSTAESNICGFTAMKTMSECSTTNPVHRGEKKCQGLYRYSIQDIFIINQSQGQSISVLNSFLCCLIKSISHVLTY